jgi:hypothetical protein
LWKKLRSGMGWDGMQQRRRFGGEDGGLVGSQYSFACL